MSVLKIDEGWGLALRQSTPEPAIKASYRRVPGGAMVYDATRLDRCVEQCFDPAHWRAQAAVLAVPGGRGQVQLIVRSDQEWILRHYRRGGWMGSLTADRYLWTGLGRTRPWQEWHLLYDLYREGLPVPRPIAARVKRINFLWYQADMITERIVAEPLSRVLQAPVVPRGLWERIGACISRFHRAGVYHADLNLDNILVDGEQRVFLLDFDRGRRRTPRFYWQHANLRRLRHSLSKAHSCRPGLMFTEADWNQLIAGYGGTKSAA